MGAVCNCCGACCDPVSLPFTQEEAVEAVLLSPRTREWIQMDLTRISPQEAKLKAPTRVLRPDEPGVKFWYRCRWFDPASRLCTNWDNRPLPCSGYPWGDDPPDGRANLPPTCAFRADIGQEVEPMPPQWQAVILGRDRDQL